jgi:hypothetical protein
LDVKMQVLFLVLFAALLVSAPGCSYVFLGALKPTGCDEADLATVGGAGAALATDGAALATDGAAFGTDEATLDTGGGGGAALATGGGDVACEEGVDAGSCSVKNVQ